MFINQVMNNCFWLLSGLVLESNIVFFLVMKLGWDISSTNKLDLLTAFVALVYNLYIVIMYYAGSGDNEKNNHHMAFTER